MSTLKTTVGDNSYHLDKNTNSGDSDDGRGGGQGRKTGEERNKGGHEQRQRVERGGRPRGKRRSI